MSGTLQSLFFQARDGLNLHALILEGEAVQSNGAPVVCLPGLSRPARDFAVLARFLRARSGRKVIALDYRGRGGSDWDADWTHYDFPTESADIQTVLAALAVASAIFVGVSRGGLHAVMLANQRPELVKAIVLGDIGPRLEPLGLARIKDYIGRLPLLRDLDAAIRHYKSAMGDFFPAASDDDWRTYAQNSLNVTPERMRLSYDPQLARTLDSFDSSAPPIDFWPQFASVTAPVLALRGECSDLLSAEVHAEMAARLSACQLHVVPGQGHAPFLNDAPTLERIAAFMDEVEGG
ncbi:alpha/beta hydrolase [Rhodoblastus sp.]|uniref:alpha/beta fold hydrolase n=1 Tax=Rhodoblastus sp. TaxID=1962975 RepID=UPI0026114441|nr:alpha/beta hydrolase [Rhodoblastus sp.]